MQTSNIEKMNDFDQKAQIINELLQGLESAKQLQSHILEQRSSISLSSNDQQALICLVLKMLGTFDKSISIAKQIKVDHAANHHHPSILNNYFQSGSPHSFGLSSPTSENSQPDVPSSKRRKTMPRWTKTVQVSPNKPITGLEGPLDDGFNWRKYGQKEILGAKFPRGYYRCAHRPSKGCEATKQVQRSDEDPTIYQIVYRGEHTCYPGAHHEKAQIKSTPAQTKSEPKLQSSPQQQYKTSQPVHQEDFVSLSPEEDLRPESNVTENKAQIFRPYSFTSTLLETEPVDNYMLGYSPSFGSPTTPESNLFLASPSHVSNIDVGIIIQAPESDINDNIYGPNSVTNSPKMDDDFEFSLEQLIDIDDFELSF